ncbi:helix-turn-helix domain-containing protein [Alteromonas sp. a30]|uniref:helix-turn-helix domain-containing protein n=1 Tax=Alteromonas sp. a30 TaxID=2730917 RepID=UPI00227EB9A6|nr:helix-turn-helix transcriptional regulator [Alteromonas sp. a30]MCY7297290.1 helix-turn-helix transcriptional regulator [Alteromonas sp. a30]
MALKSSNKIHKQKAHLLKQMRLEAGLTQQALASRLKVSRETVSAIENCHFSAISALSDDIREDWWRACATGATKETKMSFMNLVTRIFRI